MAGEKRIRDPADTKRRILAAALAEFAHKGLGGARVDVIAARAKANKRMMYHYFGNKEALFRAVLEEAYAGIREAEAALDLDSLDPVAALRELVTFTWGYYLAHPEFLTLVNSENLHRARHIKSSARIRDMSRPFVARMQALLDRGEKAKLFHVGLDAVQMNITIAAIGYYYLTNRFTGSIVFERDLMAKERLTERLNFNLTTILRLVCKPEVLAKERHP